MKFDVTINNSDWKFIGIRNGKNIWKIGDRSYYTEAICSNCNKLCLVSSQAYKKWDKYFCDNKCRGAYIKKNTPREIKKCLMCEKELDILSSRSKRTKFCSNKCKMIYLSEQKLGTHPSQESIDKRLESLEKNMHLVSLIQIKVENGPRNNVQNTEY